MFRILTGSMPPSQLPTGLPTILPTEFKTTILRIDNLIYSQDPRRICGSGSIINLAEVQLFDSSIQLAGLGSRASISSVFENNYPASNCFDGNLNSLCHSIPNADTNPWLQIDLTGLVFNKIVIYNRQDVCVNRIVRACIAIVTSTGEVRWQSTFATSSLEYTFYPFLPTSGITQF